MAFYAISVQAAPLATPVPKAGESVHLAVPEDSGKWRRDPFADGKPRNDKARAPGIPVATKAAAAITLMPELNLQGILLADKAFHALINGRVVKSGDKFDGVTVLEISRYQVVVQDDKKEKSIYDIFQGRIDRGKQ